MLILLFAVIGFIQEPPQLKEESAPPVDRLTKESPFQITRLFETDIVYKVGTTAVVAIDDETIVRTPSAIHTLTWDGRTQSVSKLTHSRNDSRTLANGLLKGEDGLCSIYTNDLSIHFATKCKNGGSIDSKRPLSKIYVVANGVKRNIVTFRSPLLAVSTGPTPHGTGTDIRFITVINGNIALGYAVIR